MVKLASEAGEAPLLSLFVPAAVVEGLGSAGARVVWGDYGHTCDSGLESGG